VKEHGPCILDLGCGNGGTALTLAENGLQVTGIDLSRERISKAQEEAKRRLVTRRVEFIAGDLNIAPLVERSFDCVLAHDALHHILELGDLLDRVERTLVPGGRLIVMEYVGMGKRRKIVAAALFALLPTYQPYSAKWKLRHRIAPFLASEAAKRQALEGGSSEVLHSESPFEEISGHSIVDAVRSRFVVEEYFTFCPFFYYLAPKIRLPGWLRYGVAHALHALDTLILRAWPHSGAYMFIMARHD
jgi:ubiquinone/menaquinone biosynthesis C-methylase UbiE